MQIRKVVEDFLDHLNRTIEPFYEDLELEKEFEEIVSVKQKEDLKRNSTLFFYSI